LFSDSAKIKEEFASVIPLLVISIVLDAVQGVMQGVADLNPKREMRGKLKRVMGVPTYAQMIQRPKPIEGKKWLMKRSLEKQERQLRWWSRENSIIVAPAPQDDASIGNGNRFWLLRREATRGPIRGQPLLDEDDS
ncbi:hypothetical protein D0Y65_031248, partial [Glycine soja]